MPDLLIELLSEEIPARMQARAAEDFRRLMTDGLVEAGLTYSGAQSFVTPRRLALSVAGLPAGSPDQTEERKGPRDGAPEAAVAGFARSAGIDTSALELRETPKGTMYFATIRQPGRPAAQIVAEVLARVVETFPWPKSMRWGAGDLRWVRPLQGILCILSDEAGAEVVPVEIGGLRAGETTVGHRFLSPGVFSVANAEDYEAKLKRAHVLLRPEERAEKIAHDARHAAFALGLEVVEDAGLLAEVAGLAEWPVVLMGEIGAQFLDLPAEVLQTSMRTHQKFFSVRNPATGRIERFITVANTATDDDGAVILAGNGRVLSARLSDAAFFWENDLAVARGGMDRWAKVLKSVTFHNKLGTQSARIARIAALAANLGPAVGAKRSEARQAAEVCKLDLSSEMVYEFPELQGVMGRYYSEAAGLSDAVAEACEAHYAPLGPSDDVPSGAVSIAVALADKIDLLTGFWAIDETPTGSRDPFALRRAALGVIRIVLEHDLHLPLTRQLDAQLLRHEFERHRPEAANDEIDTLEEVLTEIADHGVFGAAFQAIRDVIDDDVADEVADRLPQTRDRLLQFFHDRLKVHLKGEGLAHDVIDAALGMEGADDLTLVVARARALAAFMATDDGENLVQGFKRANNVLAQAEERDGVSYSYGADPKLAEADEERALFEALGVAETAIDAALEGQPGQKTFAAAMAALAGLRAPIDAFFEAVQVNAESAVLRRNRLNLLNHIREVCLRVADLTRLEG